MEANNAEMETVRIENEELINMNNRRDEDNKKLS